MSIIGIDFGSENCYIATIRSGGIEVLPNELGNRSTPTYLAFGERNRIFGQNAKAQHVMNVNNTLFGIKRLLGRTIHDSFGKNELSYLPYHVCPLSDDCYGVKVVFRHEEAVFTVQQIVAMMLSKLVKTARAALDNDIAHVVIAVPAYFPDSCRRALLDSCRIAGIQCLRLINDTSAVALSYGFYKQNLTEQKPYIVIFIDIGHTSLQITACCMSKGKFNVIATETDSQLGGRDFNNCMVRHFANEFREKNKLEVLSNTRATVRLFLECERLKKMLSANPQSLPLNIECFMEDKDVHGKLDRTQFENLGGELLRRTEMTIRTLLTNAKLNPSDIYAVELVGGSSRIPAIKSIVQKIFSMDPSTTLNLDEAVARGCVLQCALLSPLLKVRDYSFLDVQQFPIKLLWSISNGEKGEIEVFQRNHQIPFSKYLTFYQLEPFTLNAYYGLIQCKASKEEFIGSFLIDNIQKSQSGESSEIRVKIRVDLHGIFSIRSAVMLNKEDNAYTFPDQKLEDEMDVTGKIIETDLLDKSQEPDKGMGFFLKKKRLSKPIELPVVTNVLQLSEDALTRLIEYERRLRDIDKTESERVDCKNNLEEYMYELKDCLGSEAQKFFEEKEYVNLKTRIHDLEKWLYEEGEQQNKHVFLKTLKELKDIGDPFLLRLKEYGHRQEAINAFQAALKAGQGILDTRQQELTPDNIAKIQTILKLKKDWIHNKTTQLFETPLFKNPPVLTKEIFSEKEALERDLSKILETVKK